MRGPGREEKAAATLLRVARAHIAKLQSRRSDVEAALTAAETSLAWLAEAVSAQRASRGGDPKAAIELARFLDGAAEKRRSIESTRDTLRAESVSIAAMLGAAETEMAKLQRLIETARRAAARRERRASAPQLAARPSLDVRRAI